MTKILPRPTLESVAQSVERSHLFLTIRSVPGSKLIAKRGKKIPTWNICLRPFLGSRRPLYTPLKVWEKFIKLELFPSQKRGVPIPWWQKKRFYCNNCSTSGSNIWLWIDRIIIYTGVTMIWKFPHNWFFCIVSRKFTGAAPGSF